MKIGDQNADTGPVPIKDDEEVESAIKKLEGRDKVGVVGEVLSSVGGVAAGSAAAGAVAGAAGATTILGSTTLGSALGGVLVASTPVGWVIGCAAAGGLAGYGIAKMVKSGADNDHTRAGLRERLRARFSKQALSDAASDYEGIRNRALSAGKIGESEAARLTKLVNDRLMPREVAIRRLVDLLGEDSRPGEK